MITRYKFYYKQVTDNGTTLVMGWGDSDFKTAYESDPNYYFTGEEKDYEL